MTAPDEERRGRHRGRVAVVTGGSSGIGLATARRLAAEGACVQVWDLRAGEAALASGSESAPPAPATETVDVSDREVVERASRRLAERTGRIDILVNAAGITPGYAGLEQVSDRVWEAVLATNARGAVLCAQAVAPVMKSRRWGRIVNLASILGRFGFPGQTAYAASKAALVALTRVWARELGPFGITVNAVSPGYIATPMNAANPAELVAQVVSRTPVGRLGEPDDVAAAVAYLCSEEAGFVNGAVLAVDGGLIP